MRMLKALYKLVLARQNPCARRICDLRRNVRREESLALLRVVVVFDAPTHVARV